MSREDRYEEDGDAPLEEEEEVNVPEDVKTFVTNLNQLAVTKDVTGLTDLYEEDYPILTDKFFKASPWPSVDSVTQLTEHQNVLLLYSELYFRHIYTKMEPTLRHRIQSFHNYTRLFDVLLTLDDEEPELELPSQWLWDMVDEFVYQFQSFHQFRIKSPLREEEVALLKDNLQVWSPATALKYLQRLIKKGGPESEEKENNMFKMLAHFSMIALLRLNVLLGDYVGALEAVSTIDLKQKRHFFYHTTSCHATLYYHLSFALLMLRKYVDATKTVTAFLNYVSKSKQNQSRNYQALVKRVDNLHGILAMALALCPSQRVDESILHSMRDKIGENKIGALNRGDVPVFEEVFENSAPKFVAIAPTNLHDEDGSVRDPHGLQLKVFLQEVAQRQKQPDIASYLSCCTGVSTGKLAQFLKTDEDAVITALLCLKYKSKQMKGQGASDGAALDFFVNKDVVNYSDVKPAKRHGDHFIKQILRLEDMIEESTRASDPSHL